MRLPLYTILVTLSLAACGKDDDPIIEPIEDFPQAEVFPGKFVYVEDQEIIVLDGQGSEQITNTCSLNCSKQSPRWIDHGNKICYTQDFEGVFRVWEDGRYNTNVLAFQPNLWTGGAYSPDETQFAASDHLYVYLYSVDQDFDVTFIDTIGLANSPIGSKIIWSPDGTKILLYGYGTMYSNSQLHILDLVTGERKNIAQATDEFPSWTAQSDKIAYSVGHTLFTTDAHGENTHKVNGTFEYSTYSPQWSQSGDQILCSGLEFVLYDVAAGTATKLIDDENFISAGNARWSVDGQTIAFTMYYAEYQGLYVYQFADQKVFKLKDNFNLPFEWYTE